MTTFSVCEYQGNVYPRVEPSNSTTVYSDKVHATFSTEAEMYKFMDGLRESGYTDEHDSVVDYDEN